MVDKLLHLDGGGVAGDAADGAVEDNHPCLEEALRRIHCQMSSDVVGVGDVEVACFQLRYSRVVDLHRLVVACSKLAADNDGSDSGLEWHPRRSGYEQLRTPVRHTALLRMYQVRHHTARGAVAIGGRCSHVVYLVDFETDCMMTTGYQVGKKLEVLDQNIHRYCCLN